MNRSSDAKIVRRLTIVSRSDGIMETGKVAVMSAAPNSTDCFGPKSTVPANAYELASDTTNKLAATLFILSFSFAALLGIAVPARKL